MAYRRRGGGRRVSRRRSFRGKSRRRSSARGPMRVGYRM